MFLRVYLWVKFIYENTTDVRYNMRNLENPTIIINIDFFKM